jgi:adenine phosphoribosyltransferase
LKRNISDFSTSIQNPKSKIQNPKSKIQNPKSNYGTFKKFNPRGARFSESGHQFLRHHDASKRPARIQRNDWRAGRAFQRRIETVIGVESRGFIFAAPLAYHLNAGFVPVRKPKKLPAECVSVSYELEYGQDTLEMHRDAVGEGHRVLIVDDLLATGGTAKAVVDLVEGLGGKIVGLAFVVELNFLNGRAKFNGYQVSSLLRYDS